MQTQVTADYQSANMSSDRFSAVLPLFQLDVKHRAKVLIPQTGGEFPADREFRYWLCVKGIPPSGDDNWADNSAPDSLTMMVQTLLTNCIKL